MKLTKIAIQVTGAAAVTCYAAPAFAGYFLAGTIKNIVSTNYGAYFIESNGPRGGVPACASSLPNRMVLDGTTVSGQALIATILTAYSQGKIVSINGTNECAYAGTTESISNIVLP